MPDRHLFTPHDATGSAPGPDGSGADEEEEELLDEGLLDEGLLERARLDLARRAGVRARGTEDDELLDEDLLEREELDAPPAGPRPRPSLTPSDPPLLDEEELLDEGPDRLPTPRQVAGVEEQALLLEPDALPPEAHRVLASLATGLVGAVLSGPLEALPDGRARVKLGARWIEGDPKGLPARIVLGTCVLEVRLRLVDGPAPRLVLGQDLLAGRFLVDPGARHLLGAPQAPVDQPPTAG